MKMIKNEFKNLFKNRILLISVIAITFIPIIYTAVFDKSLWNPYGGIKNLPVAVVNEDKEVDLLGQKIDVGDQVVANLKKNKDLDWHFVTEKQANKGMKDMSYYMIVTIPKDFSASAASIIKENPHKMNITYTTNDSYNYIGKEISEVAATELEGKVRNQVVKSYVTAIDGVADKMIGSLEQAAGGSNQLASGTNELFAGIGAYTKGVAQADAGSQQLSNGTAELASGVGPLSSGVSQLSQGSQQLSGALNKLDNVVAANRSKINEIDGGLITLSAAAQEMGSSLQNFENNLPPDMRNQLSQQLAMAETQLVELITNTTVLNQASVDASRFQEQSNEIAAKLQNLSGDVSSVEAAINTDITNIIQSNEELSADLKSKMITELNNAIAANLTKFKQDSTARTDEISSNLIALSDSTALIAQQANAMKSIASDMAGNAQNVQTAIQTAKQGSQQIESALGAVPASTNAVSIVEQLEAISSMLNTTANDIPLAVSGAHKLAAGSSQLTTGLSELQSKIPTLSSGINQLNSGSSQLESGLNELNGKSPELISGISQLKNGAAELASGLDQGVDKAETVKITHKTINHFVDPTDLKNVQYSKVNNYGEALAPYIMSLALFVGCMLFNFVYPIRKSSMPGESSRAWWLSKVSLGFVVSSLMAIIQVTIMLLLKLPAYNVFALYSTALVTAWSYMSIVMFLAMTFDNPGRFVAMILLVLQLGGAAGTFPIQTQGKFFQMIHPYLPMSYSLYAFRNAIAGGISKGLLIKCYTILVALIVVFVTLLRISMHYLQKKHLRDVSILNDNQKLLEIETIDSERLSQQIEATKNKENDRG
ncbi:YhgE/Pip family protein [Enterococcus sp. AZ072]|uniref:YhgE/Pip family protein n=1 Tax=unclassified Enterococcus TaxID=2608891 RepID=UPI003D2B7553